MRGFPQSPPAQLKEDAIIIYCKGITCGKYVAIPLPNLLSVIRKSRFSSLKDFCDNFICSECETAFICAVESLPAVPP